MHHYSLFRLFSVELCSYIRSHLCSLMFDCQRPFVLCVFGVGYLQCSLCGFFSVMSFNMVYFVLYLSVGISLCSEVWHMLGWRANGMNSWKKQGFCLMEGNGIGGLWLLGLGKASNTLLLNMLCSWVRWLFL